MMHITGGMLLARKPQTPKGKKGKGPNVATPTEGPRRTNPDAIAVEGKVVEALPNAMFSRSERWNITGSCGT